MSGMISARKNAATITLMITAEGLYDPFSAIANLLKGG